MKTSFYDVVQGTETRWRDAYCPGDDASYHKVIDRGFVIRDDSGKPLCMVGVICDVIEQRQATAAMRTLRSGCGSRYRPAAGRLGAEPAGRHRDRTGNTPDLLGSNRNLGRTCGLRRAGA